MNIMNIKQSISLFLLAIACIFANLWITPAAIAFANNQDLNQPASLIAPEPNFMIKVYDQPNTSNPKNELGYAMSGDKVTLLQEVGSNDSQGWYLVRFDNPTKSEGWISENYVSVVSPRMPSGLYLGNQKLSDKKLSDQSIAPKNQQNQGDTAKNQQASNQPSQQQNQTYSR
jgi:hypothetical protein